MAVERKTGIPANRENRPPEPPLGFQPQTAYDLETYREEQGAYLTQEEPRLIQQEIDLFGEQISRLTLESQSNLEPLREQRQSLELRRLTLEERRRNLQTRIAEGERTKRPTGGDFKTEVKIVWGRIQLVLGKWRKKPPNSLARVLVKPLSPLARQTHPLLTEANRELSSLGEAINEKQNEISLISSQTQREVSQQALQRQRKEKELESLLDEWALENPQRLTFYLLENPQKIDGLLERYSRRATQNPTLEEGVTYLLWSLKAGLSRPNINAREFSLWLKNFCPQKTLDEWQELLKRGENEEIKKALEINFVNFPLLLSQSNQARQDFREFLEGRIKRELREGGVTLPVKEAQPYFVGSQSRETKDSTSPEPVLERQALQLMIGDTPIEAGCDETRLVALLRSLSSVILTDRDAVKVLGMIERVRQTLNAGKVSRELKKLEDRGNTYSIKTPRGLQGLRIIAQIDPGCLKITGVERHDRYRRLKQKSHF